jgi:hypothetical protein
LINPLVGLKLSKQQINSATSIQKLLHNNWLEHYAQPQFIVFDNGNVGKFKREFKQMCDNHGIKVKPTTNQSLLPQANAIIEQGHKVLCCQ